MGMKDSPYWIEDNITVPEGATLTIEPGVEVKFNGFYRIILLSSVFYLEYLVV